MQANHGLFLVISEDVELVSTVAHLETRGLAVHVWCPSRRKQLADELRAACSNIDPARLHSGDPAQERFYKPWLEARAVCAVLAFNDDERRQAVRKCLRAALPDARVLSFRPGGRGRARRRVEGESELLLTWGELLEQPLRRELRHVQSTRLVQEVRDALAGERVALLMQPDPDPDGLAAALALRTLLGRNKVTAPIVSFGRVTRPENVTMLRLLELEVLTIAPEDLRDFDRIALLDTQPAHLQPHRLPRVDVVIDHHPPQAEAPEAQVVDVRPHYGATSTILAEYLMASAEPIGTKLATALLHGIKVDTMSLNRGVDAADLDAFVSLYPLANGSLLRQMERPQWPAGFGKPLAAALAHMRLDEENALRVSCLGEVEREDLVPQMADFLLQFEGTEWAVCAGRFAGNVVLSVRAVGHVRSAGEAVRRLTASFGRGGGHRTMAKMIVEETLWRTRFGQLSAEGITEDATRLFREVIA